MHQSQEPRNAFYLLLLLASMLFVVTALAYGIVPVLEDKARAAGELPPPSPWRKALREDGGLWLLYEVAAMIVLGLASMGLDRYRRWRKDRATTQPPGPADQRSSG
ncbi:MAG: hypothetical protein FJ271_04605 [Planctomycetes bacterium]|nr:hypothetical protein [Planctomycetota bacterium]